MDKYIGKDFIHYGCGLELNPEVVMEKIPTSSRKNIRKADKANLSIRRVEGTKEQLQALREIWYYYDDPNFPLEQAPEHIVYMAYKEDRLIGGTILLPVGRHLFLNNLMANKEGKKYQLQGYLLWYIVNDMKDSEYDYIDVGVSYRLNLYRFFRKWSTFNYPVIFNPPEIKPTITDKPFTKFVDLSSVKIRDDVVASFFGNRPFTILPDFNRALLVLNNESNNLRRTITEFSSDIEVDDHAPYILDLSSLISVPFGAVIVGMCIPPKRIWDTYGCYDHYKEEYIKKYITKHKTSWQDLVARREEVYNFYKMYFSKEDVDILEPTGNYISKFSFKNGNTPELSRKYHDFGVPHTWADGVISFPCHQGIKKEDVEYIYAIYRGNLNLCSEWIPTGVKGELK